MQPSKPNDYTKQNEQKIGDVTAANSQTSPDKVSHLVSIFTCDVTPIFISLLITSLVFDGWGQVSRQVYNCGT